MKTYYLGPLCISAPEELILPDGMTYQKLEIKAIERYLNDKLNYTEVILLNDLYDTLRYPRTMAGALLGWTKTNPINFQIEEVSGVGLKLGLNLDGIVFDKYKKD